jgi:hypothetical protein
VLENTLPAFTETELSLLYAQHATTGPDAKPKKILIQRFFNVLKQIYCLIKRFNVTDTAFYQ